MTSTHCLQGHAAAVTHITLNERSNQIISLSADKVVKVLPLPLLSFTTRDLDTAT